MKIAVIGGGLGGLSAAIRLSADGHDVTVLEQNERIGGKLNRREMEGYVFDTGPSILTMPWVLEQLFASASKRLSDYVQLVRVEPQWRTFFEDGTELDIAGDLPTLIAQLSRVSERDAAALPAFFQYVARLYHLSSKGFYKKSLGGLSDLRKLHGLPELLAMDPRHVVNDATERYLADPHLRQLFNFFVMYIGSSPYAAPAIISQLVYVQLGLGIYYVQGGMYQIAEAMGRLLAEQGATVRTDCAVNRVTYEGARATGVELKTGEKIAADVVVCNLEAIPAHRTLLAEHPRAQAKVAEFAKYAPTVSGHVLLLGVDKRYEGLAHHNFFFSRDAGREFQDIFEQGRVTEDPTVYVGIASRSDPSQAPAGCDNWFVLTHVPPLRAGESFEPWRNRYRDLVLDKLERMAAPGLRSHIRCEQHFIPDDLETLYGSNGGSIYGVVSDKKRNGGFKIPSRSDILENLYFVGGTTHPGGGVPMVTLSGQLTADLIAHHHSAQPARI